MRCVQIYCQNDSDLLILLLPQNMYVFTIQDRSVTLLLSVIVLQAK